MFYFQKLTIASMWVFISFFLLLNQALATDTTISGTVSLPASVSPYGANQSITIGIHHGWNGNWYQYYTGCQSVELLAGDISVDFDCTVPDLTNLIAVEANANGLDGIYYGNFYNNNGTEWQLDKADQFDSGFNHSNIDIILLPGITIEGELQTPGGATFTTDKDFEIICHFWEDGWWQWGPSRYNTFIANSASTSYSISIPTDLGDFKLHYRFWDPLENGFLSDGYYSSSETEYIIDDAQLLSTLDGNQTGFNMEMLQGLPVTGTVYLPTGETNSDGMQVKVRAMHVDDWSEVGSTNVVIPAGETSAPYTLYVPPGENVEISYTAISGADRAYIAEGYYTWSGTSFRWNYAADFPPESPPPSVDLTLIPGYTVSGLVSLPSGEASNELNGNVFVTFMAPGSVWTTTLNNNFSINNGTSSGDYSVTIPIDASSISVEYWSWALIEYHNSGYYSDGETTWDYNKRTLLPGGGSLPNIDLTLIPIVTISGNIGLPDGLTASEDITTSFASYLFNPLTQRWDGMAGDWVTIVTGTNSAPYTLKVPADIGDIILSYSLWDNSSEYILTGYYNAVTTTSNADYATNVSTSVDQSDLNMTLVKYNSITGQISLTGGETAPKDIYIGLGALTQPDGDYHTTTMGLWAYHTTWKHRNYFLIPEGSNSVDYTINIAEDIGNTSIEYSISTSEVDYVKHGFYKTDGGDNVTGLFAGADLLAANSDHPGANMTMPHGFLVQGTVLLPEPAKKSELVEIGLRSELTGIDNFYDTTLFIPWQATTIDYSYRALFDSSAVMGMKTGGKNGYLPNLYYKTPTETVSDLALATVLNSGNIPLSIDFNLLSWSGDVNLDTHVNLTDTILSLQTANGLTGLSVFKEGDATGDSRIGVADAVYVLQDVAGMFNPVPCIVEDDCGENQFCQRNNCVDASGTCVATPSSGDCSFALSTIVCGCDGATYPNACEAAIAGTSVDHNGECIE